MRKAKLIKIGGILIAGILTSSLVFCGATSLVASDSNAKPSKTEETSKKQETINEDIPQESEEVVYEEDVTDTVYTTASLNVRDGAGISSTIVGLLPKNAEIIRVEDNEGWDTIEVAGVKYYVSDKYLTTTKPETIEKVTELLPVTKTSTQRTTNNHNMSEDKMSINSYTEGRYNLSVQLSENDKHILAALVWLEGRGESDACQRTIASVVLNRMMVYGSSLTDVVYAKNQFTPAGQIEQVRATKDISHQVALVEDICIQGTTIPHYVLYFRSSYYFNWPTVTNYCNIGNTYFSALKSLM